MTTLETLVTQASRRSPAFDWSILIPIVMELIQTLIDECTKTEAQWIAIASDCGPVRRAIFVARVRAAIRREGNVRPADRATLAYAIADDLAAVAAECDARLGDVYREVKSA